MKAPDKIYFPEDGLPSYLNWDGSPIRTKQVKDSDICYIRKDAIKDLALTIQDIELLHTFLYAVKNNKHGAFTFTRLTDEQYAEILKRFKKAKK